MVWFGLRYQQILLIWVFTLFLSCSIPTYADIIWQEDFENGIDNWEISGFLIPGGDAAPGNVTTEDGVLRIVGEDGQQTIAERENTQSTGAWSFDVDVVSTAQKHFYLAFFGEATGDLAESDDFTDTIGYEYGILVVTERFGSWNSEFVFYERAKGSPSVTTYEKFSPTEILGWHHFDITRNPSGEFKIYIDGVFWVTITDTSYSSSEVFRFSSGPGPAIDNIIIRDEFDFNPEDNGSFLTIGTATVGLSIFIMTVTNRFMLNRKRNKKFLTS